MPELCSFMADLFPNDSQKNQFHLTASMNISMKHPIFGETLTPLGHLRTRLPQQTICNTTLQTIRCYYKSVQK